MTLMRLGLVSLAFVAALPLHGAELAVRDREFLVNAVDAHAQQDSEAALAIWRLAELGYQEQQSSAILQKELAAGGFTVEAGVAGMPTSFVATAGSGKPVIAILAEFDALPGLSQAAVAARSPIAGRNAAHACGHNLFGAGSTGAAIAIREWLASRGLPGTIRLYGTPAEEGGAGKVYMVRGGLFDDVDVALHWHAADRNDASQNGSNSNKSGKFRFHGVSSHAAAAPEKGRSALDAVEAMDMMANMMREHMPQEARMHYVITRGGAAPNVVPDFAEVFYYVRHPDPKVVQALWERLMKIAAGAALGTGTTWDVEVIHGAYPLLPNHTLGHVMQASLERVGGVRYDAAEQSFAEDIYATLTNPSRPLGSERVVQPYAPEQHYGSTDVGDVSWTVPTAGFNTATWVPGTSAHSWQAAAAGGMGIGIKGMHNASKVLALTAARLYLDPALVKRARAEFDQARGADFVYRPMVGDRAPPLDYRD
ncbi:MAG: p-aminobenzoyl-glutamate hydrolase subunit B [Steroidobacteraceae bacterium]|nr:p-aminobenzoyl-glutamate hydrolase subunit B [Steroidobacteraceae bacterium]